ncbi:MAG: pantothenate kinase [Crocosphaera sp.]|nr:pantothenate kinase [Crocosphaera sp.]
MTILNARECLALVIGNSRLHWGYFINKHLENTWDTNHISESIGLSLPSEFLLAHIPKNLPLTVASVVPSQTKLWRGYHSINLLTLEDIPLKNIYATMGIDRALGILGAGKRYHFPCLLIDAGTALTLTGVDTYYTFRGGAILPGLKLQFESLSTQTAALPHVTWPRKLPQLWAMNTSDAIASGIIYTVLNGLRTFCEDWLRNYSESQIILTGGDALDWYNYLREQNYSWSERVRVDQNVIFSGIEVLMENGKT